MWGFILLACTSEIKETEYSFCSSATSALYDPLGSEEILSFPDDFLTSADPRSPTGLYLDFSESKAPWSPLLPNLLLSVPQDAKTRSGFARLGNVVMRFSEPISEGPNDPLASLEDSSLLWLDISVSPPERIPFSTKLGEDFNQLILSPLFPLRPGAKHAVFMTNEYSDAEGNCIAPAPLIKDIINDTATEPLHEMHSDYMEAISAAEINPETISHAIVFTTQADHGLMIEVSHDIEQQSYRWEEDPNCESTEEHRYCMGTLKARDYRNGKEILDTQIQGEWSIDIHLWLPLQQDEPAPVVVYGHGINNTAEDGALIAQHVVPMGLAVVSADALFHGSHPTANPDAALPALNFLGVNLSAFVFDTPNLRGSFGQSTAERLQMIRLLEQNPDVDGDGVEDLDMRTLIYHGFSLGGMMGPQLLATKPTFGAAALVAGGGNLPLFVTDTQVMQDYLLSLMEVLVGTRDDYDRIVPVIQAAVDESDPAIWARHILENRLDTAEPPDLLFPVSLIDGDVPPSAGQALARAFEIPHLSPISTTVPMLEEAEGPLHANLGSGATAAYFQLDRVSTDAGVEAANHGNVAWNAETMWMITHFLQSYLDGRTEIAEPYSALGTPPLE